MDVPAANSSYGPGQPWTCQNGWSTAPPQAPPPSNPLPTFQSLNLGPSSHQSPPNPQPSMLDYQHQGCPSLSQLPMSPPPHSPFTQGPHNTHPSMTPCSNQKPQNTPPTLTHTYTDQRLHNHNSPPSTLPNQVLPPPCGPPSVTPCPQNQGPQNADSPLYPYANLGHPNCPPSTLMFSNKVAPNSAPFVGACVNQGAQSTLHPSTFGGLNQGGPPLAYPGGVAYSSVQTSPVQQQPQWALPQQQQYSDGLYKSVPDTTSHHHKEPLQEGTAMQSCSSPGGSGVSSPSSESRYGLDPQLLPSAVRVMEEDRAEWDGKVFVSETNSPLPPLPTTDCIMEDRGSAIPRFLRSNSYCVPCEGQTALQSHLPLGALVTPLARLEEGERPLPVCSQIDCMKGCGECGAYMCPAMGWQDCGQRFYCPFCGKLSEVSWKHYQPTTGEGVRVDREKRPELSLGSYEILDTQQGEAAVLLLAVDVSAPALRGGQLDLISQQLRSLLTPLHREEGAVQSDLRVGLMTYDSRIHLYDLSPALFRPHMLVVTETEDLQLPVKEGLLVPLKDCIDGIESVLQRIPLFSAECEDSSGAAMELPVRAGLAILKEVGCSGKLLIFHTAPFTEGTNTHSPSGFFSSSKPKTLFQPSDHAVSLVKECVSQGCGVHLFVFSQQDVGGAWPGHVPYLTGGALHCYDTLQGEVERERFSADLRRSMETETGYRAQMRIFVTKDLRVSGCYGSFAPGPHPGHVALATLDWRTTLAVELAHSRALDEKKGVVIQVVLSYTSQRGERMTRVHSLSLRCSRHLLDTFRNCQAQTLLAFYCKKIYCAVLERPLQELREELQAEVTEALACYRKHCSSTSVSPGQLVLPQYLRALPVYINSLRKSEVLLPCLRSSVHQRLQLRSQLVSMDTRTTACHFYPLLLPLPVCGDGDAARLPSLAEAVRCSAAGLDPQGLYLANCPLALLLWVGHGVPSQTLVQLFNTTCLSLLPSGEMKLPVLDNPLSTSVKTLMEILNSQAPYARKLRVVKQGDSSEEALQRLLVEDKSPNGGASYADFLYHLHVNSLRILV